MTANKMINKSSDNTRKVFFYDLKLWSNVICVAKIPHVLWLLNIGHFFLLCDRQTRRVCTVIVGFVCVCVID